MFIKGLMAGVEAARRTEHFRLLDESRTKKLMVFSDFSARASGRWATSVLLFTSEKAATKFTKTIRKFRKITACRTDGDLSTSPSAPQGSAPAVGRLEKTQRARPNELQW